MRKSRLALSALALISGASLLLTGCSGGGGATATEEENALWEYFSALESGEEWNQEMYDEQQKLEQDSIAACMTKQGFEYTPDIQSGGSVFMGEDDEAEGPQWGTVEFAKEYGYGIVEWPESWGGGEEDLEEYVDPNADYVMSLSESEQNAFYEALHGPSPTEEEYAEMELDENYEWNPENQGCWGEAMEEVQNDPTADMYEDPEFADLFASMELLWSDTESDDRIVSINREWMSCMAEAGYSEFSTRDEAQNQLNEEWYAITDALNANMGEHDMWQEPSQEQQDEFQKHEIEVATADFTCAQDLKWDEIYTEVNNELSQTFVDSHKAELDAMVAKYGQQ